MDAYDLYWKLKTIWMENCGRISGVTTKTAHMAIMIPTENGYREVLGAKFNKDINAIELIVEDTNEKE